MSTVEQEQAIQFTEDFKRPNSTYDRLVFDGESFNKYIDNTYPEWRTLPAFKPENIDRDKCVKVGDKYLLYKLTMPTHSMQAPFFLAKPRMMRAGLDVFHKQRSPARCYFTTEVHIPVLADKAYKPWMSITPNEILTQRGMVRRAKGLVALAGLGMGWAARRILERKQVKHLHIVEKDPDIIEHFGTPLIAKFKSRVSFANHDAYTYYEWHGFDVVLWDIWAQYGSASHDRRFWMLKERITREGKVCVGWGEKVHDDHLGR